MFRIDIYDTENYLVRSVQFANTELCIDFYNYVKEKVYPTEEITYKIIDLLEEQTFLQLKQKSELAISLGAEIIANVRAINIQKNLTPTQFNLMLQDQELLYIERLLWLGSFETAKYYIQNYSGNHFTSSEIESIIKLVNLALERLS